MNANMPNSQIILEKSSGHFSVQLRLFPASAHLKSGSAWTLFRLDLGV
jgi:hypothetical protein